MAWYEEHEMIIKIEFTVRLIQDIWIIGGGWEGGGGGGGWWNSKLVRYLKFGNVLRSKTECDYVTCNNVCITEPIITVSSLYHRRFHQWQVTHLS